MYLGLAARLGDALAVLGVVWAHTMHLVRCSLGWGVPLTLLGDDVDQDRAHSLCGLHLCTSPNSSVHHSLVFTTVIHSLVYRLFDRVNWVHLFAGARSPYMTLPSPRSQLLLEVAVAAPCKEV